MGQYIRHAVVPMNEVVEKIIESWGAKRRTKAHLSTGHTVGIVSLRMRTFGRAASHKSGIHCKACGLKAGYFAVEEFKGCVQPSIHANLYGVSEGREVLFTQDHIVPRSKGGGNNLNNSQVMCQPCNSRKGSRPDREFKKEVRQKCQ